MEESYIEGRFGIVMEDIRDALTVMALNLEQINQKLGEFEKCIETRTKLPILRVTDVSRKP